MKSTAGANYANIKYIATRPRVMKNKNMKHGLFGKMEIGSIKEFEDWKEVAKAVYKNSKNNICMYRSVLSFDEETAKELMLNNQKDWQRYIENHIMTIAEKNKIKRENLQWVCAVHNEKSHPHAHIVFWDKSIRAKNPFTPPAMPNQIRKQIIKDTFKNKILELANKKDNSAKAIRAITNEMVDEFERTLKINSKLKRKFKIDDLIEDLTINDKLINELSDRILNIKNAVPKGGRIAYKLLPENIKKLVDETAVYLIQNCDCLKAAVNEYIKSKIDTAQLYSTNDGYIDKMKMKYYKEAEKIISNRILSGVKMLFRLNSEMKKDEYILKQKEYCFNEIIFHSLDILCNCIYDNYDDINKKLKINGDLSKEAKKELYLKNQDKGYEH